MQQEEFKEIFLAETNFFQAGTVRRITCGSSYTPKLRMLETRENKGLKKDISWQKVVLPYASPILSRSIWQIINSFIPYVLLWYLMYRSLEYSYWLTLLLAIPAGGLLIRLFIIFHDCGHSSFFKSRKTNDITGLITGILTFTPYKAWTNQHAVHHISAGNLDKRGTGDINTMTVDEYLRSSKRSMLTYRAYRNPFVMFILGAVYLPLIHNRIPYKKLTRSEKINVLITNAGIIAIAVILSVVMGLKAYLQIQLPIIIIAQSIGIWLFYVQHQFEGVIWVRQSDWDYRRIALHGCSFLKLPRILQWFTGNIGFHHVHHLSPRIPNYNLESCHFENEIFSEVRPLHLASAVKTHSLRLWDEKNGRLIRFCELKAE